MPDWPYTHSGMSCRQDLLAPDPPSLPRLAPLLLAWYDRSRRALPWRGTADPYAIWVSEIMLQQTRVETVIPYYLRFLARFPSVEALAQAEIEEVLASWSGLGYYRRARQMHGAAKQLAASGSFPHTPEGLRALPGIGDYTAAAVASIAFGVVTPVVDGNVERVVGRLLALEGDPKTAGARARLREAAAALLNPARPGDSNQALMELGATVCLPQRPRCLACPLAAGCEALAAGDPERFPPPRRRRATTEVRLLVALVEEEGRTLLFRRPEDSALLAGTWELPWVELEEGAGASEGWWRVEAALAARYGGGWQVGSELAAVRHGITHRAIEARVVAARLSGSGVVEEGLAAGWFSAEERQALPLSSLVGKVIRAAAAVTAPVTAPVTARGAGHRPRRRRRA